MTKKSSTVVKAVKGGTGRKSRGPQAAISEQTIATVRQLAWAGQHAQAIELATQELMRLPSPPKTRKSETQQMDLLDLRAESYGAIGKLDLAAKDAKAMKKLGTTAALKVQALNRLALVQMRAGNLKAAVKTATTAVKTKHASPALRAESLFRLSEAQMRIQKIDAAVETAQKAIVLFHELGDNSGAGRAQWVLALAYSRMNHVEDSRLAAHTALELCQQAGDQYGIGNALNAFTFIDVDIAERIQHSQLMLEAFETAGYAERQSVALGNLALSYSDLGLYPHSRRLQNQVVNMNRAMGAKLGLAYALGNLISADIFLGAFEPARLHLAELKTLVPDVGDPTMDSSLDDLSGELAFAEGDFETAIRYYQSYLRIAREARLSFENICLSKLGKAHLANRDPAAALQATTRATGLHRAQSFAKPDDSTSQAIWWRHVQALNANKKTKEARAALERAYDFLLEQIGGIRDEGLRRNALNKVEDNRKLLQFWVKDGAQRKLPRERLFAHLAIESNLREPFKRLADTGLRLNALKTVGEIQAFLVEEATELSGGERVMLILEKDGAREVMESILPLPSYQSGKGYEKAEDPKDVLRGIGKCLDQARLTRTAQLIQPKKTGTHRIVAPLIAQNQVSGYLYVDMDSLYGSFDDTDRDMLGMLANQAAVALDNAQWAQGLERKVEERTEELNARVDELAILSAVGEAMAKTLDVKTVTKIVGDKVRDIFQAQASMIVLYDEGNGYLEAEYLHSVADDRYLDLKERIPFGTGLTSKVIKTKKSILIGTKSERLTKGSYVPKEMKKSSVPDTQSWLGVPILAQDKALGVVVIMDHAQNAFTESDKSLLETLASNMGVAIQNARLFEAEQERVAELAIINSVQEGLAKELDLQGIIDLVGEKIEEIFKADTTLAILLDQEQDSIIKSYYMDHGKLTRFEEGSTIRPSLAAVMADTRRPLLLGTTQESDALGALKIASAGVDTDKNESYLGVPILAGEKVIGVIAVQSYKQHAYGESDLRLIQTLANAMSVALQNAVSFKAEQERVAELQIINSIQQGLAAELDFQAIVDLVGDKLREVFKTPDLGISWFDEQANLIHYLYTYEHGKRLKSAAQPPRKGGIFETELKTRKPIIINNVADAMKLNAAAMDGTDQAKSGVIVPIISSDRVLGDISLENYERENAYGESELRLLTTIAASLGTALENARLFDETQRLFKAEQERVAELEIINAIQQGLAAELHFQAIVDLVGDKLREVFDSPDLDIRWYDEKTNLVHFLYEYEHSQRLSIPPGPPAPGGSFEQFLKNRQPIIGNTVELMERTGGTTIPGTDTSQSLISVPIISSDRVIGSLQIENYERENAYGQSELRLLTTIAASLGTALENARLFDETQRLLKITEERNEELAIINSVQAGLASQLDIQAIFDLVGDKIRDTFNAQAVTIATYDRETKLIYYPYMIEKGQRQTQEPIPLSEKGFGPRVMRTRRPLMINEDLAERAAEVSSFAIGGGEMSKSGIWVPLVIGDEARGVISIQNVDQENAFSDSDFRLLTTLASSLSVSFENARLFDETQRLLKITEDRAAELAIINSVQAALAAELNIQGIYDAVGDKVREIFHQADIAIRIYDPQTNMLHFPYMYESGERLTQESMPLPKGITEHILRTRETLVFNENLEAETAKYGSVTLPGTKSEKSAVYVPLVAGDQARGMIGLMDMEREHAFSESDVRLLQTLANAMSVALENARLFDETQRLLKITEDRAKELAIINSVQEGLAKELDYQAIVELVGEKVREIFDVDTIGIMTYDKSTGLLTDRYAYEKGDRTLIAESVPAYGFRKHVIQSRQTLVLNHDVQRVAEEYNNPVLYGEMAKSCIFVPTLVGDQVTSIITLQDLDQEDFFSESDVRLLQTLAGAMSVALENARLFGETQRLLKITEDRAAELAIINSVQAALAAELNIQGIYDAVGDKIREIFHNTDMGIRILDPKTNMIHYPYTYENGRRLEIASSPLTDKGFAAHVFRTRETVVINEDLLEEEKKYGSFTLPGTESEKSTVFVPLVAGDQTRGLINLISMAEHAFSDSDVRLLQTLANAMSVALENARLFDETQRLLKITEDRAAELAVINSIQQGLAAELNFQAIVDLVGDKLREVLNTSEIGIRWYDPQADLVHYLYEYEHGVRLTIPSAPPRNPTWFQMIETRQPVVRNTAAEVAIGGIVPGTDSSQTSIAVPIIGSDRVVGSIIVEDYQKEYAFSDSDVRLLQTVAASMGVALENARLFDETQRLLKITEDRAAELAIINSVQAALAAELNIQGIYDAVGDKIRDIFHQADMNIRIYDPQTKLVHVPYIFENGERLSIDSSPLGDKGFEAHVIRTRETVVVNENMARAIEEYGSHTQPGTQMEKSAVYVPLVAGDQARGLINLVDMEHEHAFSASDVRLLQTLANSMSVALENARLFAETQRLLKETEQRAAELAIINSVQEGLASKLDMQAIYDLVGDEIQSMFNAQSVVISSFDHEKQVSQLDYGYENGERLFDHELLSFSSMNRYLITTRQPVVINENVIEESKRYGLKIIEGTQAPRSLIYVPFGTGTQVNGYFSLQNFDRENAFVESDVRLLQTLAGSMGIALENARLFNAEQQRAAELAIINSVQEGLASKLEMQAIYDLVGDKLSEVMNTLDIDIRLFSPETNQVLYPYMKDQGKRIDIAPTAIRGVAQHVFETRQTVIINEKMAERMEELGSVVIPGTQVEKSYVAVPIMVSGRALGMVSIGNYEKEHAFNDSNVRLLQTVVSAMSVALENARLFDETQRLLKETEERNAELAVINRVGQVLTQELDPHAIVDSVGDTLRAALHTRNLGIGLYDSTSKLLEATYVYKKGRRYHPAAAPLTDYTLRVARQGKSLVINKNTRRLWKRFGSNLTVGDEIPQSLVMVPIVVGKELIGGVTIQNFAREDAYPPSLVNLLETVAANMGTAIQNARLFSETERLLKVTEDRAAELAIINSVQEGLASKLDMHAIYDLVGDKIHEIFAAETMMISMYDPQSNRVEHIYLLERGKRLEPVSEASADPLRANIIRTRNALVINEHFPERCQELGMTDVLVGESPKSWLGVPIIRAGQVNGVISLQNLDRENAFEDSVVRLLTTVASSMSVALENAHLFAETEQRAAELAIINSVQEGLASKLEVQSIYDLVGDKLRQLFDTQAISLASFNTEEDTRHYHYLFERGQRFDTPDGPIAEMSRFIIKTREPLLINERYTEGLAKLGIKTSTVPGTQPTKALLRVPILIGGQVYGVIGLDNLDHENAFTASDVRLLQTLAGSLSVALESARLFEETKQNAAELATVNTVSSALASELDTGALIELVGEQVLGIFGAEIAYVALLDETGETITFPYQYGEEVEPIPYGEGLTSRIIQTGKPLLISQEVDREAHELGATSVGVEAQSYLGVPIMVGGNAVGVVSVQSTTHEGAFDENDQRLLGTIAANVGSALHNAQLYREAQESRAAAEQANHAKSAFLANMSHELRTPLNAIIGFTRIVRRKADGVLPEKQTDNLDKVLSSAEHLLSLINTVLDIAKIEAGRMDVQASNFNINALADLCANTATPLLKPGVRLVKDIDPSLAIVHSDQDKIKQIILNLLSNAAKFTHEGKIVLQMLPAESNLVVNVVDSGIGISEDALGRVFEEFQQADTSTTRQYGGTGLGLAISRNLARLLGGDLTATSIAGQGSTFTLTVPMEYGSRPAPQEEEGATVAESVPSRASQGGSKKLVLVIDDDPDAVYLLQENLTQDEFEVIGARNGIEGQQKARDLKPQAILLDIMMPDKDGWQVLHDLKADGVTADIPVILLTIVDKKALGFRLGASAYLLKPLDPVAVLDALEQVTGGSGNGHKRVLVVDDDPHVADMLHQLLPESDFTLESAIDGVAGLEAIEAHRPDVVLLDIMMPRLDGFGVIERLRANRDTRDLPIIVISAKELTDIESARLKESVAFVMRKQGFDGVKLIHEINTALETQ